MKSQKPGINTSEVEVTNIDSHGVWIYANGKEYFLPHEDFPWFKKATLDAVVDVKLFHGAFLHWPKLDVDLSIDSLEHPEAYPLVAEGE